MARGPAPELAARLALTLLAAAALTLAALEDHEAIGTAMVGAAIAFGLGAAFFDRVVEVSTSGVKLRDYRALQEAAEREAPEADPEEKEELIDRGSEVLVSKRSAGEKITPHQAVREAKLTWQRNGLAVEMRVALWLQDQGWVVHNGNTSLGQPDLIAKKGPRRAVVEVKVGTRSIGEMAVQQVLAQVSAYERQRGPGGERVLPVLVLGEVGVTSQAAQTATERGVSVYQLDASDNFNHLAGPKLEG